MATVGRPRTYHADRPATPAERQRRRADSRTAELAALRQQTAQKAYLTSKCQVYGTPLDVFAPYDAEFHFTLDVCALADNAKCACYFSPEQDGLAQDWGREVCWMNPPYGRQIGLWMEKAYLSSLAGATVCCLVPARTGAGWWQRWVVDKAEIRYRPGRIRFVGLQYSATFDAAAVIYWPFLVGQRRLTL
jgi:site-specific DNA-methyltransferase (adenine-specific)